MSTLDLIRGLNHSGIPDVMFQGMSGAIAYSNVNTLGATPAGTNPIDLILRLLTSTGVASNGAYDVYKNGIGLGIPQDQIDITSFTSLKNAPDWDDNQQLFFHIKEPEPAKDFIDNEICRPFGLYLVTGNDGKIKCVRPRNPQLFYISDANRRLKVTPTSTGVSYTGMLECGVFDANQMCQNVTNALYVQNLNGKCHHVDCTYDEEAHTFSISMTTGDNQSDVCGNVAADTFTVVLPPYPKGWETLGFTTGQTSNPDAVSDTPVGKIPALVTLTKDDMWAVRMIDNQEDRITAVVYAFDYNVDKETYETTRSYSDPEYIDLEDLFGAHEYFIYSRGLVSGGTNSNAPFSYTRPGANCALEWKKPSQEVGVNADTWAKMFAMSLIDRYRQPPIKFKANLKWQWNTLEVGDLVRVTYDIRGVLIDHERKMDWIDNRVFEIVELHPNFDGSLEATFLGHRYVSY